VTDSLTGVANRRQLEHWIPLEIERAERYLTPLSLIMFDLDHFKNTNDTYGHLVGDQVLKASALLVQKNIRSFDLFGRWGGEEFIILLPQTNLAVAQIVAEKIRVELGGFIHEKAGQVTASFGVTQYYSGANMAELIKEADNSMYAAKRAGRNRVIVSQPSGSSKEPIRLLTWRNEWETQVPSIDEGHKELIAELNEFVLLSSRPMEKQALNAFLVKLGGSLADHFEIEEKILEAVNYPSLAWHRRTHQALLGNVQDLSSSLRSGEGRPIQFYQFFINEVIVGHMVNMDSKYIPYVLENPVVKQPVKQPD